MGIENSALLASIETGNAPLIVDVRSGWEFARGHVPRAIHIPFWLLPARVSRVPLSTDRPLVVYCGHGPRAWLAQAVLRLKGYKDVALLEGHMSGWRRAGLPQE